MRVGVVNDAIFDIGHRLNLRFAAISDPGALKRKMLACILALGVAGGAGAADIATARLAEVADLDARLLSHDSATAVLSAWCRDHHLAAAPTIRAERGALTRAASADTLKRLGGSDAAQLRYRHVRLMCGTRVLSDADNWYRPDVLTPAMNRALDTTRTPFGVVVAPLGFHRRTLSATTEPDRLGIVLRHHAILSTAGGVPFSVVTESYTDQVLGDLGVSR
jgi:hypothetical protein